MKKHQTLSEAGRSGRKQSRLRLSTALLAAALLLGCLSGCAGMSFPTPSFGIQPTASEATEAPAETQELTEAATEAPTEAETEAETKATAESPAETEAPEPITYGVYKDEPCAAVVQNADQFAEAVAHFAKENCTSFYVELGQTYWNQLQNDDDSWDKLEACSMLDSFGGSSRVDSTGTEKHRYFRFYSVEYTNDPKMICSTEDEVIAAIVRAGELGAKSFRLYVVGESLIKKLFDNSCSRLHELEAKAGMVDSRMAYGFSDTYRMIHYTQAEIAAEAITLETKKEAIAYVEEKVQSGAQEISLFCTKSLYSSLVSDLDNRFAVVYDSMAPVFDLISHAGIYDYELYFSRTTYAITIQIKSLYPGKEIILAVNSGRESSLSSRLRQTLNEARSIASSCKTSDPETTAKNIHDAICKRVTYTTADDKSDNDTAVGVLLNGKADCDGYSDAFYLVCTLAGLNVRLQHGDGGGSGFDFLNSATHMWNLLELDGTWRLVDLTWDDSSDEIQHTWFNLGNDRASRGHSWNEDMTVSLADKTDLKKRPENEYSILSSSDLDSAVKQAISKNQSVFYLIFDKATYGDEKTARDALRKQSSASYSCSWNDEMRMLTVWMK